MREASDSEWELIDVGGETEYWDTRVGGDENYLGEGAFRVEAVESELQTERKRMAMMFKATARLHASGPKTDPRDNVGA